MPHRIAVTWIVICAFAGCASAQQQQPPQQQPAPAQQPQQPANPQAALSPESSIDAILDALDARGDSLADFTAAVTLATTDTSVGNETKQLGRIWMQRLGEGDSRLRVLFDKKIVNDQTKPERQEFSLANGTLVERNYADRLEVQRQVLKPGQKMDLLKLGEGPFPLPLGQDKADVQRMFTVAKVPPVKDDPSGSVHVQLKPKPGTQFHDKFATIDFWVDPASRMPVKIVTEDPNGTTQRTTELKEITVNAKLTDKDFQLPPINEGEWQIRQQAFEGQQ